MPTTAIGARAACSAFASFDSRPWIIARARFTAVAARSVGSESGMTQLPFQERQGVVVCKVFDRGRLGRHRRGNVNRQGYYGWGQGGCEAELHREIGDERIGRRVIEYQAGRQYPPDRRAERVTQLYRHQRIEPELGERPMAFERQIAEAEDAPHQCLDELSQHLALGVVADGRLEALGEGGGRRGVGTGGGTDRRAL